MDVKRVYEANFRELHPPLKGEEAVVEANRCLYCYDAPCVTACPTHIDIPRFIKQIASGNLTGSAKTILEANAFGHSCARACPVEVLCEGACVYHDWQEKPIEIARLQRRATDALEASGRQPFRPGPDNGRKVALIGAGPASLACAAYLRRLGYAATVFEKDKVAGGLNTLGIAEYKMTSKVSLDEIGRILDLGVELKLGEEIDSTRAQRILSSFDAVFLGIGLGETNRLNIPGEELPGVWDALSFIRYVKERDLGPIGQSRCTVVIGGGNTAIDATTQSKRTGAERVILAYRRGPADMRAYGFEKELAKQDGAEFMWNAEPERILGKKKVEGIAFKDGRTIPCDRVIKAIGQTKHFSLAKALGLRQQPDGRLLVNAQTLQTSHDKVFAGGDAVNGGKEVVNAAADGKRAAWGIHNYLQPGKPVPKGNEYWVSTIEGRKVAPIPDRGGKNAKTGKNAADKDHVHA